MTYKYLNKISLVREKTDFISRKISTSTAFAYYMRQFFYDDIDLYESFFIIMLNRANKTLGYAKISQGGVAGTAVDPIIIAKYAIDSLCHGIILGHNHPSGNSKPSESDIRMTHKIQEGLKLFEIVLLDHVILTSDNHYSFADEGVL